MDKKTYHDAPELDIANLSERSCWAEGYNAAVDEANAIIDELRSLISGLHAELDDFYGNPYRTP
jgi:hypothetical protein